jgi:hypothetical protein
LRTIGHHGVARLLKEERRITLVGFLHLTDMIDVIPADAIDPANGEETAADDRKLGYGDSGQHALGGNVHVVDPSAV